MVNLVHIWWWIPVSVERQWRCRLDRYMTPECLADLVEHYLDKVPGPHESQQPAFLTDYSIFFGSEKSGVLAMITCFTRYTTHTLSKIVLYAEITYDKKTFRCLEHEPIPLSRRYIQFHDSVTFVFSLLFKRSSTVLRNTFQRKGRNVSYEAR